MDFSGKLNLYMKKLKKLCMFDWKRVFSDSQGVMAEIVTLSECRELMNAGKELEAIALCESVFHNTELNFKASSFLGYAYFIVGNYEKSVQHLSASLKYNDSDYYSLLFLGHSYMKLGVLGDAMLAYIKCFRFHSSKSYEIFNEISSCNVNLYEYLDVGDCQAVLQTLTNTDEERLLAAWIQFVNITSAKWNHNPDPFNSTLAYSIVKTIPGSCYAKTPMARDHVVMKLSNILKQPANNNFKFDGFFVFRLQNARAFGGLYAYLQGSGDAILMFMEKDLPFLSFQCRPIKASGNGALLIGQLDQAVRIQKAIVIATDCGYLANNIIRTIVADDEYFKFDIFVSSICVQYLEPKLISTLSGRLTVSDPKSLYDFSEAYVIGENRLLHDNLEFFCAQTKVHKAHSTISQMQCYLDVILSSHRLDHWCLANTVTLEYKDQSPIAKVHKPVKSYNVIGQEPRSICKVGLRPYVTRLSNVLAIGGSTALVMEDGLICSDRHNKTLMRSDITFLSSLVTYGSDCATVKLLWTFRVIDCGILLVHDVDNNYFHWFTENLPRLLLVLDDNRYADYPIIISSGLHKNIVRSLELLAQGRQIIMIERNALTRISDVVYPSEVSTSLEPKLLRTRNSDLRLDLRRIHEVADRIKCKVAHSKILQPKKIYVKRVNRNRILLNGDDVTTFLESNGFVTVDTMAISFDDQVRMFMSADIICLDSGAAVTNCIFCHEGAIVCTLHTGGVGRSVATWQSLALVSSARYYCIFGDIDHSIPRNSIDFYLRSCRINVSDLAEFVRDVC